LPQSNGRAFTQRTKLGFSVLPLELQKIHVHLPEGGMELVCIGIVYIGCVDRLLPGNSALDFLSCLMESSI